MMRAIMNTGCRPLTPSCLLRHSTRSRQPVTPAGTSPATRCKRLQGEMLLWLAASGNTSRVFDGTVGALLDVYETHPDSTFRALAPSSRHPYSIYLARLRETVGTRRITAITGLDILRWHKVWREPDQPGGREKLAAARMALTVFKSALTFGALCKLAGCKELRDTVALTTLPGPRPRKYAPTADQVVAARAAAHAIGRPSLALYVSADPRVIEVYLGR
jgi:hypothetical protein